MFVYGEEDRREWVRQITPRQKQALYYMSVKWDGRRLAWWENAFNRAWKTLWPDKLWPSASGKTPTDDEIRQTIDKAFELRRLEEADEHR